MHNIFVFGKSQQCQPFPVVIQVKVLMYKTGRNSHVNITAGRSPFFAGLFIRGSYNSTTQRKGKFNSIPAYHTSYCHALRYFSGEYSGLRDSITAVLDTELIRVARSGWFDISSNGSGQLRVATTTFDSLLGQVRGSSPRIFGRRRYNSRVVPSLELTPRGRGHWLRLRCEASSPTSPNIYPTVHAL